MSKPTALQEGLGDMWRRAEGKLVSRKATCACGKTFEQNQVNKKFVRLFLQTAGAVEAFRKISPEGWLPVLCVPCERKDLGRGHGPPWHAYPESKIW